MGRVKSEFQDRIEAAQDCGLTDAYYRRTPNPHMWLDSTRRRLVTKDDMTAREIRAYYEGYDNQDDRKDWGKDA
jgi:hypothetical protein